MTYTFDKHTPILPQRTLSRITETALASMQIAMPQPEKWAAAVIFGFWGKGLIIAALVLAVLVSYPLLKAPETEYTSGSDLADYVLYEILEEIA